MVFDGIEENRGAAKILQYGRHVGLAGGVLETT
jgi:hypothetical protein